ncbi:MAG: hypothetical protein ABIG89_01835 [Candidatus Woesearchaeota archaeon]
MRTKIYKKRDKWKSISYAIIQESFERERFVYYDYMFNRIREFLEKNELM